MADNNYSPGQLAASIQQFHQKQSLPPVHEWNPDFCGDIDMRILRDGSWHYMGTPIGRQQMVRLFSTILRHDPDNHYYLVTPVEKVRITVDDAPFVAVEVRRQDGELVFITNVGDEVVLGDEHPLRVEVNAETGEPAPYIHVRDRLEALVHRNVFYQLVEWGEEQLSGSAKKLCIKSGNNYFSLGDL